MTAMDPLVRAIIDLCILLFFAKLVGVALRRGGLPENIGFILAGFLLSPSLLGSLSIGGVHLVELNDYVRVFARLGYILLVFLVGLNISLVEFKTAWATSTALGLIGALAPLLFGILLYGFMGEGLIVTLIVSACLTTSSLPIVLGLSRLEFFPSYRTKIVTNAAVVDNIIGVLILSVVISLLESEQSYTFHNTLLLVLRTLVFSLLLLSATVALAPRLIQRVGAWGVYFGRYGGIVEVFITALCFFYAALAYAAGLSPITGAIICGIAVSSSHIILRVKDYVEKVSFLFAPIFFVIVGASIEAGSLSFRIVEGTLLLLAILCLGVFFGTFLPAFMSFRNWRDAGAIGMTRFSHGSVSLVIAGVGMASSAISGSVYLQVILMVIVTFLITPILIERVYAGRIVSVGGGRLN